MSSPEPATRSRLAPSDQDFQAIAAWGLAEDPLKAVREFDRWKALVRRVTPHWIRQSRRYRQAREAWVGSFDFETYFQEADRTIHRRAWEYLKQRKAWYIAPLGWERFAAPETTRIIDIGCGDGDQTQRLAESIAAHWAKHGGEHDVHILGVDIGQSRVANAQRLTSSPHHRITMEFRRITPEERFDVPDGHFDLAMINGVFEILDDRQATDLARRIARITRRGIFIEDLLDRYPGGYPREDLSTLFRGSGFAVTQHQRVLSAPFTWVRDPDPLHLWPISLVQLTWLERPA